MLLFLKQGSFKLCKIKSVQSSFCGFICIRFFWASITLSLLIKNWEGIIHKKSRGNKKGDKHGPMAILHRNPGDRDYAGLHREKRNYTFGLQRDWTSLLVQHLSPVYCSTSFHCYLLTSSASESFSGTWVSYLCCLYSLSCIFFTSVPHYHLTRFSESPVQALGRGSYPSCPYVSLQFGFFWTRCYSTALSSVMSIACGYFC